MRSFPVKRQNQKLLSDKESLKNIILEIFGECNEQENGFTTSYGALKRLRIWVDKNQLYVETEMNTGVSPEVGIESHKKYNLFLEKVTGYTAKERAKKLQKSVDSHKVS